AVGELHERMNHRFRVNDDVDALGRQAEEPAGLDDFEGLVHEGGRIDRDLGAHAPGGMAQGFLDRDAGKAGGAAAAEWPAAGGQHYALDLTVLAALQGLENGAVFAIDG